jgi:hypothetical protein
MSPLLIPRARNPAISEGYLPALSRGAEAERVHPIDRES